MGNDVGVFRHRHELEYGITSSISKQIIGFDLNGSITNHQKKYIENSFNFNAVGDSASLENAVKIVEARHNVKVDIYNLPHPDPKTCKGCGICANECPVKCIKMEKKK